MRPGGGLQGREQTRSPTVATPAPSLRPAAIEGFPHGVSRMIDHGRLKGAIGGLKQARKRLLQVGPGSPKASKVAEIVKEAEGLLAKLESLQANGEGWEPEEN